uniref:Uncharacterized protein n=1 Tax=viral metagenome TaxID=1070528 RepID=A0A6C0LA77_9ZZZZ
MAYQKKKVGGVVMAANEPSNVTVASYGPSTITFDDIKNNTGSYKGDSRNFMIGPHKLGNFITTNGDNLKFKNGEVKKIVDNTGTVKSLSYVPDVGVTVENLSNSFVGGKKRSHKTSKRRNKKRKTVRRRFLGIF